MGFFGLCAADSEAEVDATAGLEEEVELMEAGSFATAGLGTASVEASVVASRFSMFSSSFVLEEQALTIANAPATAKSER